MSEERIYRWMGNQRITKEEYEQRVAANRPNPPALLQSPEGTREVVNIIRRDRDEALAKLRDAECRIGRLEERIRELQDELELAHHDGEDR